MIVMVAPYSAIGQSSHPHLGAARKLETIMSLLMQLDSQVVLVNSAHNSLGPSPLAVRSLAIGGGSVTEVVPALSRSRRTGKLRNLRDVPEVLKVIRAMGVPTLYWFYNAYAFEMRFALKAKSAHAPRRAHDPRARGLRSPESAA